MDKAAALVEFLSTPSARRATVEESTRWADLKFLSTPSARRATSSRPLMIPNNKFLSTPSARRATAAALDRPQQLQISIHALREEGDEGAAASTTTPKIFLSTPSARRATKPVFSRDEFIFISIHALREEGDLDLFAVDGDGVLFLSTPSARRATRRQNQHHRRPSHFYPRPPRGGRPEERSDVDGNRPISIHALREEGDTAIFSDWGITIGISIHALREEGDKNLTCRKQKD